MQDGDLLSLQVRVTDMPARTNDFQKLVKVINRRLATDDVKITESAMLYDPQSNCKREVDILVEGVMLTYPIKIGIECTAVKRALDVRVVEAVREKHRNLGINQTVIVAKNGFSEPAKNYARNNNIKIFTFNDAKRENWSKNFERLKDMSIYGRDYFLKSVTLKTKQGNDTPGFMADDSVTVQIEGRRLTMRELAAELFTSSQASTKLFKQLIENEARGPDPRVQAGFALEGKFEFIDGQGRVARPDEIVIRMGYKSKYRKLESTEINYDGIPMVVAGFSDKQPGGSAHVAINEIDGSMVATVEVGENFFPSTRMPASP